MKYVLLLVALFFAAHSALGQTNTDAAAADTNTQQQVEYQPVYQQPHHAPPLPPLPRLPPTPPTAAAQGRTGSASGSTCSHAVSCSSATSAYSPIGDDPTSSTVFPLAPTFSGNEQRACLGRALH
jgi:hypothetical protein